MEFLRHQRHLAWALVVLLVVQFLVPQIFSSEAMARVSKERGAPGIIICTATGLMELSRSGELVSAGSSDDQPSGQTECFVCLISGLVDEADVPLSPSSFTPRIGSADKACKPGGQDVLASAVNRASSARAPPA